MIKFSLSVLFSLVVYVIAMPQSESQSTTYNYRLEQKDLSEFLSVNKIMEHLKVLDTIAENNKVSKDVGNRDIGKGFNSSAEYVVKQLEEKTDCKISYQYFKIPQWNENKDKPPILKIIKPKEIEFKPNVDFKVMEDGGRLPKSLKNVSLTPTIKGCQEDLLKNVDVDGKVVLIELSLSSQGCYPYNLALLAQKAGAVAVIFHDYEPNTYLPLYPASKYDWKEGDPLLEIPVMSASYAVGKSLGTSGSTKIDLTTFSSTSIATTYNVLCELPYGDKKDSIIVGAHLDSVPEGPGINDNGTGSMSILEILLTMSHLNIKPKNKLIFAWWGAEEKFLTGSRHFVKELKEPTHKQNHNIQFDQVAMYLNFDMLGSPNYIPMIYDGNSTKVEIRTKSITIQKQLEKYLLKNNISFRTSKMSGFSDYQPFIENGIPASGAKTGSSYIKTKEEQVKYGGKAGVALDSCYHQKCDNINNVNTYILDKMSKSAAYVIGSLSEQTNLRDFLDGKTN